MADDAKQPEEGQEKQEAEKKPVCRICNNKASTRGVCQSCYGTFQSLVKKGKTTWAALEEAGLVAPSKKKASVPSKALQAFEAMGRPGDPEAADNGGDA